jgi:hypothetical protein
MTTQAPSRPPASYESGFFSALMLRRWLARVAVDRDSSGNHESTADRPTGSGEKRWLGGDVPPPSTPIEVPAPPDWLLVGIGLISLALRRGRPRPGPA